MRILWNLLFLIVAHVSFGQKTTYISPIHPLIRYEGRVHVKSNTEVQFSYPGVAFKIKFSGKVCRILLNNRLEEKFRNDPIWYNVRVDGGTPFAITVYDTDHAYLIRDLKEGVHTVEVFRRNESLVGLTMFRGVEIEAGAKLYAVDTLKRKIEFIGNSITCGYGNEGDSATCHFSPRTENNYVAYGAITARNLNAEYRAIAYSGKGIVSNYDLDDKATMPTLYDYVFPKMNAPLYNSKSWKPDVVVINLGTNDFAHHVPDSALFISTYVNFISKLHLHYPNASFFCIEGCMTKDGWPAGISSFTIVKRYIEKVAEISRSKGIKDLFVYFPTSMQQGEIGCDWHPNIIRHKKMAEELTTFIQQKMGW